MKSFIIISILLGLLAGSAFLFRHSLEEALIGIDIQELATYEMIQEPPSPPSQNTSPSLPASKNTSGAQHKQTDTNEHTTLTLIADVIDKAQQVITPGPLKHSQNNTIGVLTTSGVVAATNNERVSAGHAPLSPNAKLNTAARIKLQHMFDNQYFAHNGPDGTTPSHWVDNAGYAYKLTGENLALGDFSDDTNLVTAWMNSPGHRANILKAEFTDIGIAVGKGIFDEQETWLAVQVFGRPQPVCDNPDSTLEKTITSNQTNIESMNVALVTKKQALDTIENKRSSAYNKEASAYNELVRTYNELVETTKELVAAYNITVQAFNACMAE